MLKSLPLVINCPVEDGIRELPNAGLIDRACLLWGLLITTETRHQDITDNPPHPCSCGGCKVPSPLNRQEQLYIRFPNKSLTDWLLKAAMTVTSQAVHPHAYLRAVGAQCPARTFLATD